MAGRANQKLRTRTAIVQAAAELSRTGREVTMPEIAKAALVSEATAYRYFPDLASLLREAIAGQLPAAAEALQPVADSDDPSTSSTAPGACTWPASSPAPPAHG
jgi:AcrR family transcriptional regulator